MLPRHFLASTGISDEFTVVKLPFAVQPVHVDMLWHRRNHSATGQTWLRGAVSGVARAVFPDSLAVSTL